MAKFRKKPVVVEAVTFDELVAHGVKNGGNIVNGMPWSFQYKGHHITHENDDCYLIPTLEGTMRFERSDMLITGVKGEIYPCKPDIFAATYEPADGADRIVALEAENARLREERDEYERERNQWRADCQQQLIYTTEALQRAETAGAQLAEARRALDRAITYVELVYDEEGGEEAAEAKRDLEMCRRAALAPAEKPGSDDGLDTDYDPSRDM